MQFSYNISLNSCQCLLKNYTKVSKYSNPNDYEGKIVFISSNKPEYQSLYNKQFNLEFKAAYVKPIISRCRTSFSRNNHIENTWSSIFSFANASYSSFKIGNYTIDTETFTDLQLLLQRFIPSEEEIKKFEKSKASEKYYYLSQGYFFDKSFPSASLREKLSDCTLNDKMVEFNVMNPNTISILGVIKGGKIKYFKYYTIDFSCIFDEKISLNEFVNNFTSDKKKQVYFLGSIVIIQLILLFFFNRIYFSILSLIFIIISTLNIKAYCLQSFPISFKILFSTTITIVLSLLFLFSDKVPLLIDILSLNYINHRR